MSKVPSQNYGDKEEKSSPLQPLIVERLFSQWNERVFVLKSNFPDGPRHLSIRRLSPCTLLDCSFDMDMCNYSNHYNSSGRWYSWNYKVKKRESLLRFGSWMLGNKRSSSSIDELGGMRDGGQMKKALSCILFFQLVFSTLEQKLVSKHLRNLGKYSFSSICLEIQKIQWIRACFAAILTDRRFHDVIRCLSEKQWRFTQGRYV